MHEACFTHAHGWAQGAQCLNLCRFHPDLSDQLTLFLLWTSNKPLEHVVKNKIFTWAQKVSRAKVVDQNDVDYILWSKNTLCLKEKLTTVNSVCKCRKGYWSGFRDWGHDFEAKAVGSFLLRDDAPAYSAITVKRLLVNRSVVEIRRPP
jgi:hypothetical protein